MSCALLQSQTSLRLRFGRSPKAFAQFVFAKLMPKPTHSSSVEAQDPSILIYLMAVVFFHTLGSQTSYELWYHKIQVREKSHLTSWLPFYSFFVKDGV